MEARVTRRARREAAESVSQTEQDRPIVHREFILHSSWIHRRPLRWHLQRNPER
jgi:hypothetical protein